MPDFRETPHSLSNLDVRLIGRDPEYTPDTYKPSLDEMLLVLAMNCNNLFGQKDILLKSYARSRA